MQLDRWKYLGSNLDHGQVQALIDKTTAFVARLSPKSKKGMKHSMSSIGCLLSEIRTIFLDITSPLTDLTKKRSARFNQVKRAMQVDFLPGKKLLCGGPHYCILLNFSFLFHILTEEWRTFCPRWCSGRSTADAVYQMETLNKGGQVEHTVNEKGCAAIEWEVLTL